MISVGRVSLREMGGNMYDEGPRHTWTCRNVVKTDKWEHLLTFLALTGVSPLNKTICD